MQQKAEVPTKMTLIIVMKDCDFKNEGTEYASRKELRCLARLHSHTNSIV